MWGALRPDADRLPALRADGDREALRILLGARQDIAVASIAQANQLRVLLAGDDGDRPSRRGRNARSRLGATPVGATTRRRSARSSDLSLVAARQRRSVNGAARPDCGRARGRLVAGVCSPPGPRGCPVYSGALQ
jgi:hypothetical protein